LSSRSSFTQPQPHEIPLKNPFQAAFLAWLIPGLGHWYQGRRGKAILYAVCILGLFFVGLYLGDGKNVFWRWTNPFTDSERFRLPYLGQFFVGLPALPALIQATLAHYGAGPILWGYLAEPSMQALSSVHPKFGPLAEVGWVYTVIAGLLNILAVYDALEGPAHADEGAGQEADRDRSRDVHAREKVSTVTSEGAV
jgi:hypothetical protein